MSVAALIQKKEVRLERGSEFIELDATLSESMAHTVTVTEHPVEEGANIADHVRVDPLKLTLNGIITNHRLSKTFVNDSWTRVEDSYSTLKQWQAAAARITIKTSLETFENMLIKSISVTRSGPEDGNILPLTLDFQEIRTARSRTSTAKAPKPKIKKAEPKKEQPKKPPEKRVSVSKGGAKAINNFVKRVTGG